MREYALVPGMNKIYTAEDWKDILLATEVPDPEEEIYNTYTATTDTVGRSNVKYWIRNKGTYEAGSPTYFQFLIRPPVGLKVDTTTKLYYLDVKYTRVTATSGSPKQNGWFEIQGNGVYVPTNDTSIQSGKEYYKTSYSQTDWQYKLWSILPAAIQYTSGGSSDSNEALYVKDRTGTISRLYYWVNSNTETNVPYALEDLVNKAYTFFIFKEVYSYTQVASPSGNPSTNGWFVESGGNYTLTTDTSCVNGRKYYTFTSSWNRTNIDLNGYILGKAREVAYNECWKITSEFTVLSEDLNTDAIAIDGSELTADQIKNAWMNPEGKDISGTKYDPRDEILKEVINNGLFTHLAPFNRADYDQELSNIYRRQANNFPFEGAHYLSTMAKSYFGKGMIYKCFREDVYGITQDKTFKTGVQYYYFNGVEYIPVTLGSTFIRSNDIVIQEGRNYYHGEAASTLVYDAAAASANPAYVGSGVISPLNAPELSDLQSTETNSRFATDRTMNNFIPTAHLRALQTSTLTHLNTGVTLTPDKTYYTSAGAVNSSLLTKVYVAKQHEALSVKVPVTNSSTGAINYTVFSGTITNPAAQGLYEQRKRVTGMSGATQIIETFYELTSDTTAVTGKTYYTHAWAYKYADDDVSGMTVAVPLPTSGCQSESGDFTAVISTIDYERSGVGKIFVSSNNAATANYTYQGTSGSTTLTKKTMRIVHLAVDTTPNRSAWEADPTTNAAHFYWTYTNTSGTVVKVAATEFYDVEVIGRSLAAGSTGVYDLVSEILPFSNLYDRMRASSDTSLNSAAEFYNTSIFNGVVYEAAKTGMSIEADEIYICPKVGESVETNRFFEINDWTYLWKPIYLDKAYSLMPCETIQAYVDTSQKYLYLSWTDPDIMRDVNDPNAGTSSWIKTTLTIGATFRRMNDDDTTTIDMTSIGKILHTSTTKNEFSRKFLKLDMEELGLEIATVIGTDGTEIMTIKETGGSNYGLSLIATSDTGFINAFGTNNPLLRKREIKSNGMEYSNVLTVGNIDNTGTSRHEYDRVVVSYLTWETISEIIKKGYGSSMFTVGEEYQIPALPGDFDEDGELAPENVRYARVVGIDNVNCERKLPSLTNEHGIIKPEYDGKITTDGKFWMVKPKFIPVPLGDELRVDQQYYWAKYATLEGSSRQITENENLFFLINGVVTPIFTFGNRTNPKAEGYYEAEYTYDLAGNKTGISAYYPSQLTTAGGSQFFYSGSTYTDGGKTYRTMFVKVGVTFNDIIAEYRRTFGSDGASMTIVLITPNAYFNLETVPFSYTAQSITGMTSLDSEGMTSTEQGYKRMPLYTLSTELPSQLATANLDQVSGTVASANKNDFFNLTDGDATQPYNDLRDFWLKNHNVTLYTFMEDSVGSATGTFLKFEDYSKHSVTFMMTSNVPVETVQYSSSNKTMWNYVSGYLNGESHSPASIVDKYQVSQGTHEPATNVAEREMFLAALAKTLNKSGVGWKNNSIFSNVTAATSTLGVRTTHDLFWLPSLVQVGVTYGLVSLEGRAFDIVENTPMYSTGSNVTVTIAGLRMPQAYLTRTVDGVGNGGNVYQVKTDLGVEAVSPTSAARYVYPCFTVC